MKSNIQKMSIKIPRKLHTFLKVTSATTSKNMNEIIVWLIQEYQKNFQNIVDNE